MTNEAAKVARLCVEACETGTLNLSHCKIKTIPMAIYMLTNSSIEMIKKVDLSNNDLKRVPDKIFSHFSAAEVIDLSENLLDETTINTIKNCFETERTRIVF